MNLINPHKPSLRSSKQQQQQQQQQTTAHHNSSVCPRHPKHTQSPGVCSLCLTERLSQLPNSAATKPSKNHPWPSSSTWSSVSSLSSSCSSPPGHSDPKRKSTSTLKKSRSMAFFTRRKKEKKVDEEKINNVEAKRGIWARLLRLKNKGLTHSSTTRERPAVVAVH